MAALHTYLPQDRLRALARGEILPERTYGSALFADISGFTPLTEKLTQQLGPRRGAEELSRQINAVYAALITVIEKHGGSVISFAGDAVLCWFDANARLETGDWRLENNLQSNRLAQSPISSLPTAALPCAFALQAAMQAFPHLGLKVAVTTGLARRFVVGDPAIQQLDTLAGSTITRAATAEHLAQRGEVLTDETTAHAWGEALSITEWRIDAESAERFAVANQLIVKSEELRVARAPVASASPQLSTLNSQLLTLHSSLFTFLLPALYERETSEQGAFLTEFRPCVALFVRFVGIAFEAEAAHAQLEAFIRLAQQLAQQQAGTLLALIIGDKGNYLYLNWGALTTYEDDARRAIKTALALRAQAAHLGFLAPLQMGLTQGVMRVGAYGSPTRRAYSALGDEVNLAARLMQAAAPGDILVSGPVQKALKQHFTFEARPPLHIKGKAERLPVFASTGESQTRAIRLQEPAYALPMVGRQTELQLIHEKLALAAAGQAQLLGIVAEAGLGKSRLVAEVIRAARQKGFVGYGGACQSEGVNTPYLAWKPIWQAFFNVDPALSLRQQTRLLAGAIADQAPTRVEALPLLNPVLDLSIPANPFTQTLEPKLRQSALHALLEDCLKAATQQAPTLVVIEDLHWIDALSHDLLEQLAKALTQQALCFVLAYRPTQLQRLQVPRLEALPQFTKIELTELSPLEAQSIIRAKLAQLYPVSGATGATAAATAAHSDSLPPALVEKLMARAQGNPFYLEELLNYLHDRGLDPHDATALNKLELPDSLHTLILSRIDQLREHEKTTLRVASIIGRRFRAHWLTGYYPTLGNPPQVRLTLEALSALDITSLDAPEPELAYLFKHIVTHEVAYESLPFATRAQLHEQLAQYLEHQIVAGRMAEAPWLETLAFHYGLSANTAKQRLYLRKAGEAAQQRFANETALDYYGQLLPLLAEAAAQIEIQLKRGAVLELQGKWDAAERDYRAALALAGADAGTQANAQMALGQLGRLRGDYAAALDWLHQAKDTYNALADPVGLAKVWAEIGTVWQRQGEYAAAQAALQTGLAQARAVADKPGMARALNNLGLVALQQGDPAKAQRLLEECLALRRELEHQPGIAWALNDLGLVAQAQGDYTLAQRLHAESLALRRKIGDKEGIAVSLGNLGMVTRRQGDYASAQTLYAESLALARELGAKLRIAGALNSLGCVAHSQGDYTTAYTFYAESLTLAKELGAKLFIVSAFNNLGVVARDQGQYAQAESLLAECVALSQEIGAKPFLAWGLLGLGLVALAKPNLLPSARDHLLHSLRLAQEVKEPMLQVHVLIGFIGLAYQADHPHRAAQLLGAAATALQTLNTVLEMDVRHFHAQLLAAVQASLGEVAFNTAWAAGEKMSLDEAITLALELTARPAHTPAN